MAKVYVSKPEVEILTSGEMLAEQLLIIEKIGRISHRSERQEITPDTAEQFIRRWAIEMKPPHESILEHGSISLIITMNSRGLTHEQVRHRIAAYMQESTRWIDYAGGKLDVTLAECHYVIPPGKDLHQPVKLESGRIVKFENGLQTTVEGLFELNELSYKALRQQLGWNPGEARQILAIGIMAKIAVTINFRALREMMEKRLAKQAHWEIRSAMVELLNQLKEVIPLLVCDFVQTGVDKYGIPYFERRQLK